MNPNLGRQFKLLGAASHADILGGHHIAEPTDDANQWLSNQQFIEELINKHTRPMTTEDTFNTAAHFRSTLN